MAVVDLQHRERLHRYTRSPGLAQADALLGRIDPEQWRGILEAPVSGRQAFLDWAEQQNWDNEDWLVALFVLEMSGLSRSRTRTGACR
ncbi:MAG: hypothetical protein NXI03_10245 [Alphaproteobacteria bacterium]|nr:hypothetical protein [Alphaproteobacteria bacterium]